MHSHQKEKLHENIGFTALHVSKVNHLVDEYHRIHRVPFNSLTASLATILILLLMWISGFMNVVHVVMQKVGTSIVSIEYVPSPVDAKLAEETTNTTVTGAEEEPLIDLSFITSFFTEDPKFSVSGVLKYSILVGLLDTLIIIGLAIGITYGTFYLYHYIKVKKYLPRLKKIAEEIKLELTALEESIIPQEYWHIPYLNRMLRYIEQNRAEDLRECLELIDLDIRHKQIIDAIVNDERINTRALSESIVPPSSKVNKKSRNSSEQSSSTQLSN